MRRYAIRPDQRPELIACAHLALAGPSPPHDFGSERLAIAVNEVRSAVR